MSLFIDAFHAHVTIYLYAYHAILVTVFFRYFFRRFFFLSCRPLFALFHDVVFARAPRCYFVTFFSCYRFITHCWRRLMSYTLRYFDLMQFLPIFTVSRLCPYFETRRLLDITPCLRHDISAFLTHSSFFYRHFLMSVSSIYADMFAFPLHWMIFTPLIWSRRYFIAIIAIIFIAFK